MAANSHDRSGRSEDIELRVILRRLWSGKILILSIVVAFTLGAGVAAFVMTPIYRASVVLVDASERNEFGGVGSALGQLGGLASLAGINLGGGTSHVEESIAVLGSREFTERFILDYGLLPKLFADRWDEGRSSFRGDPADWPIPADGYEYFDNGIRTIGRDRLTGLITLSIEWRDPMEAAEWANTLVARLNGEMRARAIASTDASVGYLEQELEATPVIETRQAINRLMETQINQRMLANVTQEFAFRVVDRAMPADPRKPVRPNKVRLLSMGLLLGLILGVAFVLAKASFVRHDTTA